MSASVWVLVVVVAAISIGFCGLCCETFAAFIDFLLRFPAPPSVAKNRLALYKLLPALAIVR